MQGWEFKWNAEKRTAILESGDTAIHINADKMRKFLIKNGIECKKVGEFMGLFLGGMEAVPKSYYKIKAIK